MVALLLQETTQSSPPVVRADCDIAIALDKVRWFLGAQNLRPYLLRKSRLDLAKQLLFK